MEETSRWNVERVRQGRVGVQEAKSDDSVEKMRQDRAEGMSWRAKHEKPARIKGAARRSRAKPVSLQCRKPMKERMRRAGPEAASRSVSTDGKRRA